MLHNNIKTLLKRTIIVILHFWGQKYGFGTRKVSSLKTTGLLGKHA